MTGGHRYRVRVLGRYVPTAAPLIAAGGRSRSRGSSGGPLEDGRSRAPALRSARGPRGLSECRRTRGTSPPGAKGAHEAKLTADPQQTGVLHPGRRVRVRGGPVDLDDHIELPAYSGAVIAAARAESGRPEALRQDGLHGHREADRGQAIARVPGEEQGDRVTIGRPEGYLVISCGTPPGSEAACARSPSRAGAASTAASSRTAGRSSSRSSARGRRRSRRSRSSTSAGEGWGRSPAGRASPPAMTPTRRRLAARAAPCRPRRR